MIDAKHSQFGEDSQERAVERLRRCEIAAEGLLRRDAPAPRTPRAAELLDHSRKQTGGNSEIVQRPLCRSERNAQEVKRRWILVVAVDIAKQRQELVKSGAVDAAMALEAFSCACFQLVEIPARFCDPNDGHVQMSALHHRLKRREHFLVRQISSGTKEEQGIARSRHHRRCARPLSGRPSCTARRSCMSLACSSSIARMPSSIRRVSVSEEAHHVSVDLDCDSLGDQIFLDHLHEVIPLAVLGGAAGNEGRGV